uniref:CARD- and ANK-containing Inflammasome Adaptor Protein n=1 Tax=Scleropages formosus TaxID=113540 RepID=A0A8C9VGS9_SCLFO
MSYDRTREEKNSEFLDVLLSQGERACRLFFYPCLKLVEPDLYQSIRTYVGEINKNVRDARRQLIGYLLERDKEEPRVHNSDFTPPNNVYSAAPLKKVISQANKKENNFQPTTISKANVGAAKKMQHNHNGIFDLVATGKLSLLEELWKGKDVNAINSSQETLLHIAAQHDQVAVMKFLISKGAKLDIRDSQGRTALHRAAEMGNTSATKVLLQNGADIYALDKTFLHVAAIKNNYNLVMVLLKSGSPVDAKDNQRKTSLFHAVNLRNENTARVLLEAGAKVDSDIMEKTPLHFAAMGGHGEVASVLLARKASFRAKDMDGCTPAALNTIISLLITIVVSVQVCSFKCSKCFYCIPFKVDSVPLH